jgi:hypothetical protein
MEVIYAGKNQTGGLIVVNIQEWGNLSVPLRP